MVLADLFSLTEIAINYKIRWLDIAFGIGILFVAHMNERELGLASLTRKH